MNRLTKTLGALLIGVGVLGCPLRHRPEPIPEPPPYTFYTDENEIKERFVEGENVDVSQALDYNPILNNHLVKVLTSYLRNNGEKSLATARTIYVQYGGIDQFPYYSNLENVVAIANQYQDATEIQISEGTFGDGTKYVIPEQPIKITGSGEDQTTLKYIIYPLDYLELSNTRMEGADYDIGGNEHITISLGLPASSYIHNNLFYGSNGAIAIDPISNTLLEYNTFDKVIHPEYNISISFEGLIDKSNRNEESLIMRYNEIKNTPIAIQLFRSANAGVLGDLGNNMFLDVRTVVYNPENYPQGFVGNAWAETMK